MAAHRSRTVRATSPTRRVPKRTTPATSVLSELERIEHHGGSGTIELAPGRSIEVSHLDKVFFPEIGATKGDVMRYYARIAKFILPTVADRPLVLKRTPDGVTGELFFQQNAHDDVPDGVRVENVAAEGREHC